MASANDEVDKIALSNALPFDIRDVSVTSKKQKAHKPMTNVVLNGDTIDVNQNNVRQEWATIDHPYLWIQNERLQKLALEKLCKGDADREHCSTVLFLSRSFSEEELKQRRVELFFKDNYYVRLNRICYSYGCINDENSEHTSIIACDDLPLNTFPMLKNNDHTIKICLK